MELTVKDFEQEFYSGIKRQGTSSNPKNVYLFAVIWSENERQFNSDYMLNKNELYDMLFGGTNSVAHWISENSLRRFNILPVSNDPNTAILGPIYGKHSAEYYKGGIDKNTGKTAKDDGFDNSYHASYPEAIVGAYNNGFSFDRFDFNNDNIIDENELIVVIFKKKLPSEGNDGFQRDIRVGGLTNQYLKINNKEFRLISEIYTNLPHDYKGNLAVAIEEIMHQCVHIPDMYPDNNDRKDNDPERPGQLNLTDAFRRPVHLDAYNKLKLGWLNPTVVNYRGIYYIRQTNLTGDALLLYNKNLGKNEFFIIENRTKDNSYDEFRVENMNNGLAIWHCIETDEMKASNWPRKAINLRRAQPLLNTNTEKDRFTLFSADDVETSYILSDNSFPQNLKFSNGQNSGIVIKNISTSGYKMSLEIDFVIDTNISKLPQHKPDLNYHPNVAILKNRFKL